MKTSVWTKARLRLVGGALAAVLAASWSAGVSAQSLKYLSPWAPGNPKTGNDAVTDFLLAEIPKGTGGKVKLQRFGPEVVPPFQQLEPASSGVFDIHYSSPAYHAGATGIGQMVDTIDGDLAKRKSSGIWGFVDKHYQTKHNLKLIALIPSTGYQFILKEPIGADGGLQGRKIRSNPAYDKIIESFGGSPVQLTVPQVYTSLQKGLIDGTAWPMHTMLAQRLHEVAKYIARPTFATSTQVVFVNLAKWKTLAPDVQKGLLEVGSRAEQSGIDAAIGIMKAEEAGMVKNGVKFTQLGDQYAKRINEIFNEGIWQRAIAQSGDEAREFLALIKKSDMVNK